MGKIDFSEYDFPDDFFEEDEFDSRIEELKTAVKENVKQEIIDKISSLERENEELRVFRDRRDEIVGEYRRAIAQAEEDARRAEDKARHASLRNCLARISRKRGRLIGDWSRGQNAVNAMRTDKSTLYLRAEEK